MKKQLETKKEIKKLGGDVPPVSILKEKDYTYTKYDITLAATPDEDVNNLIEMKRATIHEFLFQIKIECYNISNMMQKNHHHGIHSQHAYLHCR